MQTYRVLGFNQKKQWIETLKHILDAMIESNLYAAPDMTTFNYSIWPEGVILIENASSDLGPELVRGGYIVDHQQWVRLWK